MCGPKSNLLYVLLHEFNRKRYRNDSETSNVLELNAILKSKVKIVGPNNRTIMCGPFGSLIKYIFSTGESEQIGAEYRSIFGRSGAGAYSKTAPQY